MENGTTCRRTTVRQVYKFLNTRNKKRTLLRSFLAR